jgi:hypothetical protein
LIPFNNHANKSHGKILFKKLGDAMYFHANWKYRAINSAALQILVWNRASSGLSLQFNLETEIFYSIVVVAIHDAIDFRQDVVNRNIQNLFVQALCFGGYAAANALATLVRKEILTWQERGNIWLTLAAGRMLVWNLCCDRYNAIAQLSQMPSKYTDSSDLPTEKLWASIRPEINPKIVLDQTITQEQYKAVFERSQTWACWREEAEAALMAKMNGDQLTHDLFCIKTLNTHLDKVLNCVLYCRFSFRRVLFSASANYFTYSLISTIFNNSNTHSH